MGAKAGCVGCVDEVGEEEANELEDMDIRRFQRKENMDPVGRWSIIMSSGEDSEWIHLDTVKNVECLGDQENLDGMHHPDSLHIFVDKSEETLPIQAVQGCLLGARWCVGA